MFTVAPSYYFSFLDSNGKRKDLISRPELTNSVVDYRLNKDINEMITATIIIIDYTKFIENKEFIENIILAIKDYIKSEEEENFIFCIFYNNQLHCFTNNPHLSLVTLTDLQIKPYMIDGKQSLFNYKNHRKLINSIFNELLLFNYEIIENNLCLSINDILIYANSLNGKYSILDINH